MHACSLTVERMPDPAAGPAEALVRDLRVRVVDGWPPGDAVRVGAVPLAATDEIDKVRPRADYIDGVILVTGADRPWS